MLRKVDQLGGFAYSANGGFLNGFALAYQRDDRSVVIGIHFAVEEMDSGDFHGFDYGVNFGRVAAFGKIWNAFDKSAGHGLKDNGRWFGQATACCGCPMNDSVESGAPGSLHRGRARALVAPPISTNEFDNLLM
jgi:hypothetical protein